MVSKVEEETMITISTYFPYPANGLANVVQFEPLQSFVRDGIHNQRKDSSCCRDCQSISICNFCVDNRLLFSPVVSQNRETHTLCHVEKEKKRSGNVGLKMQLGAKSI